MCRSEPVGSAPFARSPVSSVGDILTTHFAVFFGLSVIALLVRALLLPDAVVMADEYFYAKTAQLWFLHQQDVRSITAIPYQGPVGFPNSLFFAIYRYTFLFGDNFYVVAKMFNVFFASAAALAVMLVARQYVGRSTAAVITLLALWLPSTSYVPYFMPEPLYECLIWWGLAAFFLGVSRDLRMAAVALGSFLGAAILVKPTTGALLAAANLIVLTVWWDGAKSASRWRHVLVSLLGLNGAFLAVGYTLNRIVTGRAAWDPVGSYYRYAFTQLASSVADESTARLIADHGLAYCFVLVLLFGPALVALVGGGRWRGAPVRDIALQSAIWIGLAVLVAGTIRADANWERVYPTFHYTGIYSTRYMQVLFPLLIIGFFWALPIATVHQRRRAWTGVPLAVLCLLLALAYHDMENLKSARELAVLMLNNRSRSAFIIGTLALVTLYYGLARKPSARVYAVSLAGYSVLSAVVLLSVDLWELRHEGGKAAADAARVATSLVAPTSRDQGYVIVDQSQYGSRFMFRYPGTVGMQLVPSGTTVSLGLVPGNPDWVVLVGNVRPGFDTPCLSMEMAYFCPLTKETMRKE